MKRFFIVLILILLASGIYGESEAEKSGSAGFGFYFLNDFGGGFEHILRTIPYPIPMNSFDVGFFLYGDFVYFKMMTGLFYRWGLWTLPSVGERSHEHGLDWTIGVFSGVGGIMGFFLKYPFLITPKTSLFPIAGIEYNPLFFASFAGEDFKDKSPDWDQLWIKIGSGIDYKITGSLLMRFEVLYGFRTSNDAEADFANIYSQISSDENSRFNILGNPFNGHSLTIRMSLGLF